MKISDQRTQTNRCIHRHYLETSEHWATFQTKDVGSTDVKPEAGEEEEDFSAAAGSAGQMSIMTVAHLNGNEPLVRARIVAALKREKDRMIPHIDMVFKIGFQYRPPRQDRRRLNRILTSMVEQGIIEKVGVRQLGARGDLSCIRLVDQPSDDNKNDDDAAVRDREDEEQDMMQVERPNILITIPVEKQLIDLLIEAGAQGLTIRDMKGALGELNSRTLEAILGRYERSVHPPHLCDYAIQSVLETVGREKRLRWFSLAGYHERCRLDGLTDLPGMKQFTYPEEAGGFSRLETIGFYETPLAFREFASTWNTNASGFVSKPTKAKAGKGPGGKRAAGQQAAGYGSGMVKQPRAKAPKSTVIGRPKGATKEAKLRSRLEAGEITQEEFDELLKKPGKPRGKAANDRKRMDELEAQLASGEIDLQKFEEEVKKLQPKRRTAAQMLADLQAQLAAGRITQEKFDEELPKLPKPRAWSKPKAKVARAASSAGAQEATGAATPSEAAAADDQTQDSPDATPAAGEPKLDKRSKAYKLEQDLKNGVVTQEEYEELKKKLPKPKPKPAADAATARKRKASEMLANAEGHEADVGSPDLGAAGPSSTPASDAGGEGAPPSTAKVRYPNSKEGRLRKQLNEGEITQEEYRVRAAELRAARSSAAGSAAAAAAAAKLIALEKALTDGEMTQAEFDERKKELERSAAAAGAQKQPTRKSQLADLDRQKEEGTITADEYEKQKEELEKSKPPASGWKAKQKNPIGPDGKPKTGRPRKYPEGTTTADRARILRQQRELGLVPEARSKRVRLGTGSATPGLQREGSATTSQTGNTRDAQEDSMMDVADEDVPVPAAGEEDAEMAGEEAAAGRATRALRTRTGKADATPRRTSKRGTRASAQISVDDEGVSLDADMDTAQAPAIGDNEADASLADSTGDPYSSILGKLADIAGSSASASASSATGSAAANKQPNPPKRRRVFEKLAPGEKRGRGRPRKYARVGPPTIAKLSYGTYPDLVIYPPVVLPEPKKERDDDGMSGSLSGQQEDEELSVVLPTRTRSGKDPAAAAAAAPGTAQEPPRSSRRSSSRRASTAPVAEEQVEKSIPSVSKAAAIAQSEPVSTDMQADQVEEAQAPLLAAEEEAHVLPKPKDEPTSSMRDRLKGLQAPPRPATPEPAPAASTAPAGHSETQPSGASISAADAAHTEIVNDIQTNFVLPEMPAPVAAPAEESSMIDINLPAMPEPTSAAAEADESAIFADADGSITLNEGVSILPSQPLAPSNRSKLGLSRIAMSNTDVSC